MKIQGTGAGSEIGRTSKAKKKEATNGAFDVSETSTGPESVAEIQQAAPTQGVHSSLLMLQERVELSVTDKQQVKMGQSIIDGLEQIKMGIINQSFSRENLQNIVANLRNRQDKATHPELENILLEIETRAEVELAKLQYAAKKAGKLND